MNTEKKTLFIIDGSSIIYRAFHAIPSTFTNSKGMPTNAVYGFTQSLRKILNDFKPGHICIAFDVKGPSFRHGLFVEYKAERPPMPDLLSVQIPFIKRLVRAFDIPVLEMEGFEADDVIATLVKKFSSTGFSIAIITGDKDMYQLVDGNTVILDYLTGKEYGPEDVAGKFGVAPSEIRDLLGLAGDSTDNIPGVPGIGLKTAAKLLSKYHSLERVFENIQEISGDKLKRNLTEYKDQALLSRELATLHPDVPLALDPDALKYTGPDFKELEPLLNELEFKKILKEMLPTLPHAEPPGGEYSLITGAHGLKDAIKAMPGRVSMTPLLTEEGFSGRLAGFAIGMGEGKACYVHAGDGISEGEIVSILKPSLEDSSIKKDTDDSKALYLYFSRRGVEVKGVDIDTSIASYLLNPSKPEHTADALAYEYLGLMAEHYEDGLPMDIIKRIVCQKACNILRIAEILEKELEDVDGLQKLYADMELPLSKVLARMEALGIKVEKNRLEDLSKEIEVELASTEERIYASAGCSFNINSPKQLAEVLFERLKLKPLKKTKTGFSTDEEVLTQLAPMHEVPQLIMNFRQLSKLKSTYVDALTGLIDPETGRVHTSFNQTVTATGRLSSSRPNLQNIPIRGEVAGRIREAFVAEKGFLFLSADYSQIELRLVAHLSGDPVLKDAFMKGEDIHTRTASGVFGVLPGLVTAEMRRRAKAINFGIIYGMGPYGLSTELGISMKEALDYINSYFAHYSLVKAFIDRTVEEAKERGYTVTLFGRRRFIPELKSPVESTVRLGQRLAINTPIQGSAADMIKAAMITISRVMEERGFKSRMILQIHDELVFEAAEDEMEEVSALVKKEMEEVLSLSVPVKVNIKTGANWNMVENA
ncbi:MAG: DNA polymerase I [Deltaproteobacteria bacterium]|nr:DNA polymerase I [Deltaproteobacteria bacterium]